MNKKLKKQFLSFFILLIVFSIYGFLFIARANTCSAGESGILLDPSDQTWDRCLEDGSCTLKHLVYIFVSASDIILGVTGSLALLAFVVGGAMFLVSSGNSETVTRGKQVIIGSVIGLAVVFISYIVVQYIIGDNMLNYIRSTAS